MLETAGGQFHK